MLYRTSDNYPFIDQKHIGGVQQIQLKILDAFIKICEENDLTFFCYGGTLLGAIRHDGFIPWDDDIDLAMPRKDYQRFLAVANQSLPAPFLLETPYNTKGYFSFYSKIVDSSTTYMERSFAFKKDVLHGVCVDIFPLDYYEKRPSILKRGMTELLFVRCSFANKAFFYPGRKKHTLKKLIKACAVSPLFLLSANKCARIIDFIRSRKSSELGKYTMRTGSFFRFDYSDYRSPIPHTFEGRNLFVPANYAAALRKQYGDYLRLPEESERHGGHYLVMYSFDTPFRTLIERCCDKKSD